MVRDDLELADLDTTDDFEMETCYVFPQICQQIRKNKLYKYKMTRYDVRIWKKDRTDLSPRHSSYSSSSSSSSSGEEEETKKKRKLDEL